VIVGNDLRKLFGWRPIGSKGARGLPRYFPRLGILLSRPLMLDAINLHLGDKRCLRAKQLCGAVALHCARIGHCPRPIGGRSARNVATASAGQRGRGIFRHKRLGRAVRVASILQGLLLRPAERRAAFGIPGLNCLIGRAQRDLPRVTGQLRLRAEKGIGAPLFQDAPIYSGPSFSAGPKFIGTYHQR
jgi:hypothetical protein